MADNVVFYKGPRHGQSLRLADNSIREIVLPVMTNRVVVAVDGRLMPEFIQAVYRRTAHLLSGDRRIYQYDR